MHARVQRCAWVLSWTRTFFFIYRKSQVSIYYCERSTHRTAWFSCRSGLTRRARRSLKRQDTKKNYVYIKSCMSPRIYRPINHEEHKSRGAAEAFIRVIYADKSEGEGFNKFMLSRYLVLQDFDGLRKLCSFLLNVFVSFRTVRAWSTKWLYRSFSIGCRRVTGGSGA